MGDHYRTLGVSSSASKDEIKAAFRKLAVQFHPDKHSHSSPSARDAATLKFKQLSLAYEVLSDDRKRAAYNLTRRTPPTYNNSSYNSYGGNRNDYYSRGGYNRSSYNTDYSYRRHSERAGSKRWVYNLDAAMRYMTTREFLRSLVFASLLLAGTVAIDMSGDALWKMHNTGKSFEDVMKSVHNNSISDRDKE